MLQTLRRNPLAATLVPAGIVVGTSLICIGACTGVPCVSTGVPYGLWLEQCPATDLRLQADLSARNMVRGDWGYVSVTPTAQWLDGDGPYANLQTAVVPRGFDVDFSLLDGAGETVAGIETRDIDWDHGLNLEMKLPEVPDGDYRLRATVDSGFETVEVDADLRLYAPALVHLMTDRPLYKPGQEVLLRSAVLRRTDSTPIGGRPGTWTIRAPDGTEMLVEKVPTDDWGVSATTFPLDSGATVGTWTAQYTTGDDVDQVTFAVRPFELPRFTVELKPDERWYGPNDDITVTGTARYTSGAPVANSEVTIDLSRVSGRWPMPLDWEEQRTRQTDAEGRFELELGEVPADLIERAGISVSARVVDEAGETARGGTTLQLSVDDIVVTPVTELGDGLVADFNNRAYLRVTRPDGSAVADAALTLTNPYDPSQPEMEATTDADGVAALQVDPGKPVTIVDPPPPVRPRPLEPDAPSISSARAYPGGRSLNLAERRVLDRIHPAISACGRFAVGNTPVEAGLMVSSGGAVQDVVTGDGTLERCVATAMRRLSFGPGDVRMYDLTWTVPDSLQPSLRMSFVDVHGQTSPVESAFRSAAIRARPCMPRGTGQTGARVFEGQWSIQKGGRSPRINWNRGGATGLSPGVLACVQRQLTAAQLDEPAEGPGMGVVRIDLSVPQPPGSTRPQATTRTGFELAVAATGPSDEKLGDTRVRFSTGDIPRLRLRPTPALARAGEPIAIEMLRGPTFSGDLPKELKLEAGNKEVAEADVDPDTRTATFQVPDGVDGFLQVRWGGAKAVVFVQPDDALAVDLSTDQDVYRPGDTARITVTTTAGESPTAAAVSLAGVDKTLGQLAPLLGPDDWGRVTVRATGTDAFGQFGPRALQLGQIRGENAALAAVLKVQNLPEDTAGDLRIAANGHVSPPVTEVLTTNFYRALEALVDRVRTWEKEAPKDEQMTPETLSGFWTEVLAGAEDPIVDAYGRDLTLKTLPSDLLEQTGPRQVVADSRRLPEDVTNWPAWVQENAP